jgi:hypothetical protein
MLVCLLGRVKKHFDGNIAIYFILCFCDYSGSQNATKCHSGLKSVIADGNGAKATVLCSAYMVAEG